MPEREQLIEIAAAVTSVLLMLGAMLFIGTAYGGTNGTLNPDGAQLLVGVIVGFILLMTAVGVGLAYVLNDPEDGLENEDDEVDAQNTV
ncbi:DUF7472 family protein [Halopiger xanaduensis]|uniref:Uncharacterized protein n=1 Tax=Halopiger xanaduensis (strain DSM 18323 / JCM 14033 / SH-6) TaxID=797210 RepID=F8D3E3_HALXS|nr:hypothetical protein [Halopiger xanaduensis]AEH36169.1 hypothetical protein Halxa_1537 [Halopiger xanaduensis SH-6]